MTGGGDVYAVPLDEETLAESRRLSAELEARAATEPRVQDLPPEETRRARAEGRGTFPAPVLHPDATTSSVPGRSGPVPVRLFRPQHPTGVYLHIHGGGWVLGGANEQDLVLHKFVEALGLAVVSVDYRLAPEHPFPAGPEDCEDAALWLVEHAESEFGTGRLLIGGESAGAHLAVLTLLQLRDNHGRNGDFLGANLSYGVFDLSMSPSASAWGERLLVLSTPLMRWYVEQFLGSGRDARDPQISPLYAELSGLPPALFSVGSEDLLVDDSVLMAARWADAGNDCRVELYPSGIHGFLRQPLRLSAIAREREIAFARACLA